MTRLLPALLLCACSHGTTTDCAEPQPCTATAWEYVCFDTALPADPVKIAVREWGSMLCARRRFGLIPIDGGVEIPAQCRYMILYADPAWPWVQTDAAGFADIDRGIAWIVVDRVPDSMLRACAAHELGHLLGARTDGSGIMADPLQDVCITKDNVRAVR